MSDASDSIAALPPLRDVIAAHGLTAIKGLGQHFLLDLNLTAKIARAAGDLRDAAVIEVGPGPGGLTRAILEAGAAKLIAIERDERCIAALQPLIAAAAGRLALVEADALATDAVAVLRAQGWRGPIKIVANLPYNVGTALLLAWLERPAEIASITVLVQKEVAERLAAPPRSKAYGRLSVLAQWLCEVDLAFDIGPRAFTPPPQVTSTVVNLIPRKTPLAQAVRADLETVTKAAFGQRRKMLRASLKMLGLGLGLGLRLDPLPLLEQAAIAPTARAEELDVAAFCRLANAYGAAKA